MSLFDKCHNFTIVEEIMAQGIYPYFITVESAQLTKVIVNGKELIMVGSNNYLGLTMHDDVINAAVEATRKYGSGCTGSRFLNGNLDLHAILEEELARFMNKEAALVFSTGFQTNLGTISTLALKGDGVFIDREDHASIVDGTRLSFGRVFKFRHSDMDDLERVLGDNKDVVKGKLIVVDGIFSIGGDIVDLPRLIQIAEKYDARVMVDDAHSIGVLGDHGRGTASHFGLEDK
ncbi:unnamed protein product, partial [marine sediment metagenome]